MDKAIKHQDPKFSIKTIVLRVFRAVFKTVIVYLLFIALSTFTAPLEGFFNYNTLFSAFAVLYLFFIFIIELTHGTIFQHVFSIANAFMVVIYFAHILNTGVIHFTVEQMNLMIDVRFFLSLFVLGGILGFAKNLLKLLNFMNVREERWLKHQIRSL
jgi:hypothetical protein